MSLVEAIFGRSGGGGGGASSSDDNSIKFTPQGSGGNLIGGGGGVPANIIGGGNKGHIEITDGRAFTLVGDVAELSYYALNNLSNKTTDLAKLNANFLDSASQNVYDAFNNLSNKTVDLAKLNANFLDSASQNVYDTLRYNSEQQMDFNKDMLSHVQNSANSRVSNIKELSETLATGSSSSVIKLIIIASGCVALGSLFFVFKKR